MRHCFGRTEGQRDVAMGAGVQIQDCARLCTEIDDLAALQDFQDDDLVFHQRGNGDRLAAVLTQPHQVLTPHRQDIEPFAQLLAQDEELDARRVARGVGVLMHEAVPHQRLEMPVDRRLRRIEILAPDPKPRSAPENPPIARARAATVPPFRLPSRRKVSSCLLLWLSAA